MAEKLVTLNGSSILYNDLRDRLKSVSSDISTLDELKVDSARVSEDGKYLYLMSNGVDVAGPFGPFSGGGGGGGGGGTIMNLTNKSGWASKSVPTGTTVFAEFTWSSLIDGIPTGLGVLTINVNGTIVKTMDIEQGDFTVNLTDYVTTGEKNKITISITDSYDNMRRSVLTLSFVNYMISSDFDSGKAYSDAITYTYKPSGIGDKILHFFIDGIEFETRTISTSNREDSILIPKSSSLYPENFKWHGAHKFRLYFTVQTETEIVTSNTLEYELICYDEDDTTPIITSTFAAESEAMQYSNAIIPYYVFNTRSSYSEVELLVDGELISSLPNVSREQQTWTRRLSNVAIHTFTIKSGVIERSFNIKVNKLDVEVSAETLDLALHLSSEDRSNEESEESRKTWQYTNPVSGETIKAEFNDKFSWGVNDGWLKDDDGIPFLRLKDEDRITIPYQPFSVDKSNKLKQNGATFEFEFKISSVFDYDTDLISCYSGSRKIGFNITAQKASIAGTISSINSQYKEDEHVRISFVINKLGTEQFIYCYINGIISGVVQYNANDLFVQDPAVNITLGSKDAVLDIYRIRIYQRALSRFQMVNNWIADMQNSQELLRYYKENDIYDTNDMVSLDKIKNAADGVLHDLPYIVVDIDSILAKDGTPIKHLPTYKGEKLLCSGYYVNPVDEHCSFSWKNAEIDVQGTSSQAYPVKNFKLKFKKAKTYGTDKQNPTDCSGFILTKASEEMGEEVAVSKYSMRGWDDTDTSKWKDLDKSNWKYKKPKSIETNTFVFKADFASSEGANNVELVRYYNDLCTASAYATPAQKGYSEKDDPSYREGNSLIRQGIDGFPMVWFQNQGGNVSFIGKYNFNNHKGTEEVYGLEYNGEEFEETKEGEIYRTIVGAPDESWEFTDNNNTIALFKRVAGDATTTTLIDSNGDAVTYDAYLKGENLEIVKKNTLKPLYEGTYENARLQKFVDLNTYNSWLVEWRAKYSSLEDWMSALLITSIYNAGETLDEDIQLQRAPLILLEEADIRDTWKLTEKTVQISPADDMLGIYGKGEYVAHAFEVRFPGEWYDTHTVGRKDGGETVKVDRFVDLQRWIVSTWPEKATNESLKTPEYGYNVDSADYRKAKFKNELNKYFDVKDTTFYYIYTEAFLMIDSRVKNSFPTYFAITHDVEAVDAETGKSIYDEVADGDVIEEGVKYYKRSGEDTEESPYVYELYEGEVDAPAIDDLGNHLFVRHLTKEETLDSNGWPLGRWCWLPYDMDTGIGINNEGLLVFNYSLEDTEGLRGDEVVKHTDPTGVPVFNGASSVFWNNFREQFQDAIQADYQTLRSGAFRYLDPNGGDSVEKRYEDHQKMWPAAIFNEDAYYKYIKPLLETGENRLGMCLGSKEQQRKWWLFNRFRFLDSKYVAGDAVKNRISFRANAISGDRSIKITPYIDLYVKIRTGEGWESQSIKTYRNQACTIPIPVESFGDTEAYIYSADQIKTIEGMNKSLAISTLDISTATNLQNLDVAGESNDKPNTTLIELHVGANKLLRTIDARYCSYLGKKTEKFHSPTVDMTNCEQLEEAYFEGTALSTITLPSGGRIRKVHLPSSITTLNIENQHQIEELQIIDGDNTPNTSNITKLVIKNVNDYVQQLALQIIEGIKTGTGTPTELDLEGFNIRVENIQKLTGFLDKLSTFTRCVLQGTITVSDIEPLDYSKYYSYKYGEWKERFQDLDIDCYVKKTVIFKNYDGTEDIDTQYATNKAEIAGKVEFTVDIPFKPETADFRYDFDGWALSLDAEEPIADILNNVDRDLVLYPHYKATPKYTVIFKNYDGSETLDTQTIYADQTSTVMFTKEVPAVPGFDHAKLVGWGYAPYYGSDVEVGEDLNHIVNVHENKIIYAQMSWKIKPESITIVKDPAKIDYYVGDMFDKTGMEVHIVKMIPETDDDPSGEFDVKTIEFICDETTPLTKESTQVEVKVDDNNVAYVSIGMAVKMEILTEPTKKYQETTQPIDYSGLELLVTFTNGHNETIADGYTYFPQEFTADMVGSQDVIFSYRGYLTCKYNTYVVEYIPEKLEDFSWDLISRISQAGQGPATWKIGDTKKVYISTGSSNLFVDGTWYEYRILSFDHNIKGSTHNGVVFDKGDDHVYELPEGSHSTTFGLAHGVVIPRGDSKYVEIAARGGNGSIDENHSFDVSWHKGCNGRNLINNLYYERLKYTNGDDPTKYMIPVTKGQSDYSWDSLPEYDEASPVFNVYWADICPTQTEIVFIPSIYELTGEDHYIYGNNNSIDGRTALESTVSDVFDYYRNAPASLRVKNGDSVDQIANWWTRSMCYCRVYATTMYMSYGYIRGSNIGTGKPEAQSDQGTVYHQMVSGYGFWVPCFNV